MGKEEYFNDNEKDCDGRVTSAPKFYPSFFGFKKLGASLLPLGGWSQVHHKLPSEWYQVSLTIWKFPLNHDTIVLLITEETKFKYIFPVYFQIAMFFTMGLYVYW